MPRNPIAKRLMASAHLSAKARRHEMVPFRHDKTAPDGGERYLSSCRNCDMQMCVKLNPAPNQIDIGGEAVAINCTRR